ncbi:thioredoxin family protein [Tetragenococcus halophilus]|uniref:thioredoxin family protein n=1 Tax=Tetragenococcus halophilus TaxID=51669 RepID=UPI00295E30D3|nr:thioredoxin family protein [Tetragenococcus halophilus]
MKKIKKLLNHFLWSFFLLVLVFLLWIHHVEKQAPTVYLEEKSNKTVVFYRDDCPHCQHVFPYLYYRKLIKNDVTLVNLNNPANRLYIAKYKIKSVPTVITPNQSRYAGSHLKTIHRVLNRVEKEEGIRDE